MSQGRDALIAALRTKNLYPPGMYAGKIAEMGSIRAMFTEPLHPYTQLLISSLPRLESKGELHGIPGIAPSLLNPPSGCVFHPRCPHKMDICVQKAPTLIDHKDGQMAACHLYTTLQPA